MMAVDYQNSVKVVCVKAAESALDQNRDLAILSAIRAYTPTIELPS